MVHRSYHNTESSHEPRTRSYPEALAVLLVGLLAVSLQSCTEAHSEAHHEHTLHETAPPDRPALVLGPEDADHFWVFAQSKDTLGSGGAFDVYIDPERHPEAAASFARFGLGVGGALPEHRHEKTEEIAYFLSGEGMVKVY